jgi:hypothetical protein
MCKKQHFEYPKYSYIPRQLAGDFFCILPFISTFANLLICTLALR